MSTIKWDDGTTSPAPVGNITWDDSSDTEAQRRKFRQSEAKGYDATPPTEDPNKKMLNRGDLVTGITEPLLSMASSVAAVPLSVGAGVGATILDASGVKDYLPADVQKRVQHALTYEPRTQWGQSEYNPLNMIPQAIGKVFDWGATKYEQSAAPPGSSPLREAGASGSAEAIRQLPVLFGAKTPAAAAATEAGLQGSARWLMGKALKPPAGSMSAADIAAGIQTMLDEGINVSRGGLEKIQNKITTLNDQIKEVIAESPAKIDKAGVAARLDDLVNRFQKQVASADDTASIRKVWNDFMSNPLLAGKESPLRAHLDRPAIETTLREAAVDNLGPPIASTLEQVAGEVPGRFSDAPSIGVPPPAPTIPIQLAQEMKQGTYRALGKKAYGELKGADVEAQKTLARALKEDVATAAPEVGPLNARESKLLNVIDALENRVAIEGNKNPAGLGLLNPKSLPAWFFDRSSLAKSIAANLLNATGKAIPGMEIAGPAIGGASSFRADQEARKRRLAEMLKGR
jgi:hypothetical protein